jgi:hypothetical protein
MRQNLVQHEFTPLANWKQASAHRSQTQAPDRLWQNMTDDRLLRRRFLSLSMEKGGFWDNMSEEHV